MDLMLDTETLGNTPNSVLLQIGACYFNRYTGEIGETFLMNVDLKSSLRHGFEIVPETFYWWLGQSDDARKSILESPLCSVENALNFFNTFAKKASSVWSHKDFDFVIVMNHLRVLNYNPSFRFSVGKDIRTLTDLGNHDWAKYEKDREQAHNALEDCKYQVKYCVDCFNYLREVVAGKKDNNIK